MNHCQSRLPGAAVLVSLLVAAGGLFAQPGPGMGLGAPTGSIAGQVYDADLNVPIEYANIVLHSQRDSAQVNGTVTDNAGRFVLTGIRPGRYYVDVSFIGYRHRTVSDVTVSPGAVRDLGRLTLRQSAVAMPGVEATAERPSLEYRIDKKVVDVSKMATAASGTAVDVLENTPSVKVDVEGNVSLRGSENFTVLIDGKPSPIEGSDALQQIPAPTIDKIEIITNPSAKYDPEGVSGIINVLLKKQKQAGMSGTASLDAGLPQRYGGSILVNYRRDRFTLFAGADLRRSRFPGERLSESWTRDSTGDTTWSRAEGTGDRGHNSYGLRAGGDYAFTDFDRTSLSFRYGDHGFGMNQEACYRRWLAPGTDTSYELSQGSSERGGTHLSVNLEHQHRFNRDGHELLASAHYMRRGGDEWSSDLLLDSLGDTLSGRREEETGPRQPLRFKLDYSLPLRTEDKFEAGAHAAFHRARSENRVSEYDTADRNFKYRPEYSQAVEYSDNILAFYSQYAGKLGPFGFQPGLRVESADRLVEADTSEPFEGWDTSYALKRWDLFPTLHLSYDLPAHQQVMASYARRIQRPRGWELWPFVSRQDAYNVRKGNPDLKPEITDALEAGWQMPLGSSRISAEAYYRITHDKVERIRSVYAPGVILHTAANVGADYSLGTEILFDVQLFKWWRANVSGDIYDYRVTGQLNNQDFSNSSFNWGGRVSSDFTLPTMTRLQLSLRYRSPEASAQGTEAGRLMTDAAIRQQFLNRQLSVTLQVRDLLGTGKFESTAEGQDFYSYFRFKRAAPMVSLNLTWNFNNYRPDRRQRDDDSEDMDNGGEFEQ